MQQAVHPPIFQVKCESCRSRFRLITSTTRASREILKNVKIFVTRIALIIDVSLTLLVNASGGSEETMSIASQVVMYRMATSCHDMMMQRSFLLM
eukprot:745844-Hanusia_phi.AAC.2